MAAVWLQRVFMFETDKFKHYGTVMQITEQCEKMNMITEDGKAGGAT